MEVIGLAIFKELKAIADWHEAISLRDRSLTTTSHRSIARARITPGNIPAVIGGVIH
jgi:hypothetical protein